MTDQATSRLELQLRATFLVALALLPIAHGSAQDVTVELAVTGIEDITGNLAVAVFDTEEAFDARNAPTTQALLPVDSESMSLMLVLPEPGEYAIIVYQDINLNGKIDMSRIGVPTEPYGFSNNARSAFGPPGFRKTRMTVTQGSMAHEIRLR